MQSFESIRAATRAAPVDCGNYWPLAVPPACVGLWWCILAAAFNVPLANGFAIIASGLVATIIALALLADALGLDEKISSVRAPDDLGERSG